MKDLRGIADEVVAVFFLLCIAAGCAVLVFRGGLP
jgi:hypothetical protein